MKTSREFLEVLGKCYIELSIANQSNLVADIDLYRVNDIFRLMQDTIEDNGYQITGDINFAIEEAEEI